MPNDAFFKLSKEKQDNIIECAYNEFANNTYEKASIFLIAKKSEISRASFYCYFKDKEDIYKYLVLLVMKPHILSIKNKINNDRFFLAKSIFEYLMSFYGTDKQKFVTTLLKNMNPQNILYFSHDLDNKKCNVVIDKMNNQKTKDDILIISFMIISNISTCLLEYFENNRTKTQTIKYFNRVLEIIENGIKGEV